MSDQPEARKGQPEASRRWTSIGDISLSKQRLSAIGRRLADAVRRGRPVEPFVVGIDHPPVHRETEREVRETDRVISSPVKETVPKTASDLLFATLGEEYRPENRAHLKLSERRAKWLDRLENFSQYMGKRDHSYAEIMNAVIGGFTYKMQIKAMELLPDPERAITIRPLQNDQGEKILLVTATGTDAVRWRNVNNMYRAIQLGWKVSEAHPYVVDIERSINNYLQKHPEFQDISVLISGLSQGGMAAQLLARKNQTEHTRARGQEDPPAPLYHIRQMVTFGTPLMGPPVDTVKYTGFQGKHDMIAYLSRWSVTQCLEVAGLPDTFRQQREIVGEHYKDGAVRRFSDPNGLYSNSLIELSGPQDIPYGRHTHQAYETDPVLQNYPIKELQGLKPAGSVAYYAPSTEVLVRMLLSATDIAKDFPRQVLRAMRHYSEKES